MLRPLKGMHHGMETLVQELGVVFLRDLESRV